MNFINHTPFAGNAWESVDSQNDWFVTALARVKFKLLRLEKEGEWVLQLNPNQGELFLEDEFYDEEVLSSVRYESDYVPFKPYTDIIVNTKTYSFYNNKKWDCSVAVYDDDTLLNSLILQIKNINKDNEEDNYLDVRYEKCKGGIISIKNRDRENEKIVFDEYNLVGCGNYPREKQDEDCYEQIKYFNKSLKYIPPGFGFIHRSWRSRLDYAGTYNQEWIDNQHPLPPKDFDPYHNQGAHPLLICKKYLKGGERVELSDLIKGERLSKFSIPNYIFIAKIYTNTQIIYEEMNLDTFIVDIYDKDVSNYSVYASWRSYTKLYDAVIGVELMLKQIKRDDNG